MILTALVFAVTRGWAADNGPAEPDVPRPASQTAAVTGDYVLGPGDQLSIWALGAEEISDRPVRIDPNGYLDLPLIGRMKASGMTVDELRTGIAQRLESQVKHPEVSVNVTDFRSQPVSVLGAVNHPGVYQLQGRKSLPEVLSMAEGPRADAGNILYIKRRSAEGRIPLPDTRVDASGQFSTATVSLADVLQGTSATVYLAADDVITVPRSPLVYVLGEVHKPGGFVVGERSNVSVLQAVAMAEGLSRFATAEKARILRANGSATRVPIPVDVRGILAGKKPDIPLQADDILVIPNSRAKGSLARIAEVAGNALTGVAIYRVGMGF